jgi:hypothetical protein
MTFLERLVDQKPIFWNFLYFPGNQTNIHHTHVLVPTSTHPSNHSLTKTLYTNGIFWKIPEKNNFLFLIKATFQRMVPACVLVSSLLFLNYQS